MKQRYFWVFVAIAFLFLLLKYSNIAPRLSDEGFYFYSAHLLSQGILPYRDFFFQHLPGQLLLLAGVLKVTGFSLTVMKIIPLLFSLASAWLLYRILEELRDDKRSLSLCDKGGLKDVNGLLGAGLFLFSFTALATTDHATGVHEAVFFLLLFWYFLTKLPTTNYQLLFSGLSLFTGLTFRIYILPAALGILLFWILSSSKFTGNWKQKTSKLLQTSVPLVCSVIPYFILNISLWKTFGDKFLEPVWHYHFLKSEGIDKGKVLGFFAANEWILLILGFVGVVGVAWGSFRFNNQVLEIGRFGKPKLLYYALFGLLGQLGFLLVFADIYYFYLLTIVPFLVVFAVLVLTEVGKLGGVGEIGGNKRTFSFTKVPFLILAVFGVVNFQNYYQNHAKVSVVPLEEIVTLLRQGFAGQGDDGKIFGDYTLTPLLALSADLTITDNEVDTNKKRYDAGYLENKKLVEILKKSDIYVQTARIEENELGWLGALGDVSVGKIETEEDLEKSKIISLSPDFIPQRFVKDNCELLKAYPVRDYEKTYILLWKCK